MRQLLLGFLFVLCSNPAFSKGLSGSVKIDGSSTVFPITEAIAEEFGKKEPRVRVQVGVSGTGGGFKKFTKGDIDINDASRKITKLEADNAQKNKIDYLKLAIAYDGISVVVNPANNWASSITTQELKRLWGPDSKVKLWSEIRKEWPKEKIELFGPGTDSGTYDYFTEAINGKSHSSRPDFTKSEDDNVLVKGVAGNKYAMAFFGFAYFEENQDKLKALSVNNVMPSFENINLGKYAPLSREIFIYVSKASLKKPEVLSFVQFYLEEVSKIAKEVGYIPLPKAILENQKILLNEFIK